jgi:biopolymer transport protein TolQ
LNEVNLIELLRNTGFVVRSVLVVLLIFSVWSWGIILSKALLLRKVRKESDVFWKIFRKGQNISEIGTACEALRFTPLVSVFNAGAELLRPQPERNKKLKSPAPLGRGWSEAAGEGVALQTATTSAVALQRALQRSAAAQLTELEKRMTFLATTASVAPFIGLFGTVWGVMNAFSGLANANVATLRAVAPGIAEALVTTALGLFAAVPAVIAYNQFVYHLKNLGGQLDDLQVEMLTIAERNEL